MRDPLARLLDTLEANRGGRPAGVASLCTAHPVVLEAAMRQAAEDGSLVLIEATSNQVDQFGGYTGMKPADFVGFVAQRARAAAFPADDVLLGGDHLGPNRWQGRPAAEAMDNARTLVAAYAAAGFRKLHLDASMHCAGDPGDRHLPLADEIVAARAAELAAAAETAWPAARRGRSGEPPVYVIGTEVPVPGGAQGHESSLRVTAAADVARTIEATRAAFLDRRLGGAWDRVVAVVAQPGVEYGDDQVFDYRREAAAELSAAVQRFPRLVYEAHSTDYQTPAALRALVEDHFCILKVGPWLTFALREALFALESIERELVVDGEARSHLRATLDRAMVEHPESWRKYYCGTPAEQTLKRAFSLSDRSRYYWPVAEVQQAVARLEANLRATPIPVSLLSQHLPHQCALVRAGRLAADPRALAESRVRDVLVVYAAACRPGTQAGDA